MTYRKKKGGKHTHSSHSQANWVDVDKPNPADIALEDLKNSPVFPAPLAKHVNSFGITVANNVMLRHKTMGKIHRLVLANNKKAFAGIYSFGPVAYYDLWHLVPDYFNHIRDGGKPANFVPNKYPPNPWRNRKNAEDQTAYDVEKKNFYKYKIKPKSKVVTPKVVSGRETRSSSTPARMIPIKVFDEVTNEPMGVVASDGSTASYYELPAKATELQHLIMYKDMNSQMGEIFRACYRYGQASHSDKLRDAKKIKFYIEAELERLECWRKSKQSTYRMGKWRS